MRIQSPASIQRSPLHASRFTQTGCGPAPRRFHLSTNATIFCLCPSAAPAPPESPTVTLATDSRFLSRDSPSSHDAPSPQTPRSPTFTAGAGVIPKSSSLDDADLLFAVDDDDNDDQHFFRSASTVMATANPIEIQRSSASPQNRSSNLTTALQQQDSLRPTSASDMEQQQQPLVNGARPIPTRHDSLGFGVSSSNTAARPISVKGRRESMAAGSFMGGMSWGGLSVGSWVQDE